MLSPTQHLLHHDGRPGSEPDVIPGSPADLAPRAAPLCRALARGVERLRAALNGLSAGSRAAGQVPPARTSFSSR